MSGRADALEVLELGHGTGGLHGVGERGVPASCEEFLSGLRGPTAFRVPGRDRGRSRFVVALLHGNEPSGLRAVHALLREPEAPAVDLWLVLGAVEAAQAAPRHTRRMLPGRRDLNRCFRPPYGDREGRVAEAILALAQAARPEAFVDLHNNSGDNPAYALGAHIDGARLSLAALFATRFVHYTLSLGTFMEAVDPWAPAVTIECGRAGDVAADAAAIAGLHRLAHLPQIDTAFVSPEPMSVLINPVRVQLKAGVTLAFAPAPDERAALTLDPELDRHNFEVLAVGTPIGWLRDDAPWPFEMATSLGQELSTEYLARGADGVLRAAQSFVPIMVTCDPSAAIADCLFYVVHRRG
jgi:hypothetical protein